MEKYLITCSGIVDLPREYLEKEKYHLYVIILRLMVLNMLMI